MRIKRYVGRTMKEALSLARSELGEDVLILSTRKLRRGGFLGLFGGEVVFEVTAAAEESPKPSKSFQYQNTVKPLPTQVPPADKHGTASIYQLREILSKNPEIRKEEKTSRNTQTNPTTHSELEEIKDMIGNLQRLVLRGKAQYPPPYDLLAELLESQELSRDSVERIIRSMMMHCGSHCEMDESFWNQLTDVLITTVRTDIPFPKGKAIFVGPTGVGKTTTVAKLAAKYHLDMGIDVMLVTVDTFRIAAADQLRTYAELIGIPFAVAYTPKELSYILKEAEEHKLILIDTAGKNPHSELHINELMAFMNVAEADVVYLVLSAVTRHRDLLEAYRRMKKVGVTHFVFTKLDETRVFGPLIDLIRISRVPVAYFTNGQRVPDDIEEAKPKVLASLLVEEVKESEKRSSGRTEEKRQDR